MYLVVAEGVDAEPYPTAGDTGRGGADGTDRILTPTTLPRHTQAGVHQRARLRAGSGGRHTGRDVTRRQARHLVNRREQSKHRATFKIPVKH
jgi:hypothetical protein